MSKEALLFPGQGLSSKDIIGFYTKLNSLDPSSIGRRILQVQEALNKVHGTSEFDVMYTLGDESSSNYQKTAFIQPVIYALSIAAYELSKDKLHPFFVLGHSLGEYSAITASGVIELEEGLEMVTYRGFFMQDAGNRNNCRLVSLQGIGIEQAIKLRESGLLEIALINGPELIVVGCVESNIPLVEEMARAAGAKRTVILQTSGAFHTSHMQEVVVKLEQIFLRYKFGEVKIPVIANIDGEIVESGVYPKGNLLKSLTNPVQWAKSQNKLKQIGVDEFIEVGPGNSLQSLARLNGIPKEQIKSVLD
ncbi:MAG: ACP S-malonyltransferase [Candidatus Daviesbacteria bacterium]